MKWLLGFLERQQPIAILGIALGVTAIIGLLDHVIGPELSTAVFYLLPIAIAAWFGSRRLGFLTGLIATLAWTLTDITAGHEYSHPAVIYWNALVRLVLFLIMAQLLSAFSQRLRREEAAADTDSLTGLANSRGFYEQLEAALLRARRYQHVMSLAYMDLDNFKHVNDTHGHTVGDQLLITVAKTLKESLRNTDVIARLGGDEFIILLTETDFIAAESAMRHANHALLEAMQQHAWPVTFSIGMVTFNQCPPDTNTTINIADKIMYGVKKQQKNAMAHSVWPDASHEPMQDSA